MQTWMIMQLHVHRKSQGSDFYSVYESVRALYHSHEGFGPEPALTDGAAEFYLRFLC